MPRSDFASHGTTDTAIVPSAARTTSGNASIGAGWGFSQRLVLYVHVTAASGTTPTLVVNLEDSHDGTNYATVASTSPNITAAGYHRLGVTVPFGENLRVSWVIAGTTPSFTFSVSVYSE
jgi:hypothetical protein